MSKLIITTVGTSIISNNIFPEGSKAEIEELKDGGAISNYDDIVNETAVALENAIRNNRTNNKLLSAELASLGIFKQDSGISKDDTVVLFSSDSGDGKFCASVNKKVLDELGWCDVPAPIVIEGLKTRGTVGENISETFMEAGLKNLSAETEKILNSRSYDEKYFNITGGFKATIPFVTILAFGKGMSLIYLYGESIDLIEIKPPDSFNYSYERMVENTTSRVPRQISGL